MGCVDLDSVCCQINVPDRSLGEQLLDSYLLSAEHIKNILAQVEQRHRFSRVIKSDKCVIKLGKIPIAQFETQFPLRLAKAFADRLGSEHASIGGPQAMNLLITDTNEFHECHPVEKELFQRAQGCLQPVTLNSLILNNPAYQLQQLLRLLLEGAWQSPKMLPVLWYDRVTAGRLSIAAALYLLKSQQGHDWLMHQPPPTAGQVAGWANAIARGEIPPEQVAQLLTGNPPSGSAWPTQRAYSPLVVMRWLLPLWRQPAVRQAIHRLKGGRGVQRFDAYLSRCLQRQDDDAVRETDLHPVALSRDDGMLPECDEMPASKGGFRSPNEPRLSSQDISNAGLLLLWPLLPQLFSLLGLWGEEQFVSEAARWQAVYGLDRLVWGEANPTEERLTLNQVLCGVSFSTSVPPPAPLSLLQKQQIDDWLTAIGQQLVGWQKLSLADIRQLFLQRAGEISTEGAVPQISVWPEPYDFLLRDWPWPMTLASFPWSEQPLAIVWPLNGFTG